MTNTEEAVGYIISCCPTLAAFSGTNDAHKFLAKVAVELTAGGATALFPERYKEHVAHALNMVAANGFTSPPAAVASVYLATRFEFYFRLLSSKLKADGCWVDAAAKAAAKANLASVKGLDSRKVSNVGVAYKIMKLDQSRPAAQVFDRLDKALYPAPGKGPRGFEVTDIGDRIAFARHSAGHGELGDISFDGVFYGLVTAIIFYNQT